MYQLNIAKSFYWEIILLYFQLNFKSFENRPLAIWKWTLKINEREKYCPKKQTARIQTPKRINTQMYLIAFCPNCQNYYSFNLLYIILYYYKIIVLLRVIHGSFILLLI